jgi:ribosomal protein L37E
VNRTTLLIILFQLSAGILLLHLGRRRKFQDKHPHCRQCGYDLFGQPTPVLTCSECGASLTSKGGIEVGCIPRKANLILAGASQIVFAIMTAGTVAQGWIQLGNWVPYATTNRLISYTSSNDVVEQMQAMTELKKRIAAGSLSDAQWETLAQSAIAYRSNKKNDWDPDWARIVNAGQSGNHLSNTTIHHYRACLIVQTHSGDMLRELMANDELGKLDAVMKSAAPAPQ